MSSAAWHQSRNEKDDEDTRGEKDMRRSCRLVRARDQRVDVEGRVIFNFFKFGCLLCVVFSFFCAPCVMSDVE